MVDFIYQTTDLDDQVCQWVDELCRTWHGSCSISKNQAVGRIEWRQTCKSRGLWQ
nr:MAG TPA: hypothetical protein [Caudoviricetes sp.]